MFLANQNRHSRGVVFFRLQFFDSIGGKGFTIYKRLLSVLEQYSERQGVCDSSCNMRHTDRIHAGYTMEILVPELGLQHDKADIVCQEQGFFWRKKATWG